MFKLMKVEPKIQSAEDAKTIQLAAQDTNISFENIVFEYIEGKRILDGLTFNVPAGQRVAIVGGSGSGKSTLVRLLYRYRDLRVYSPSQYSLVL